MSDTTKMMEEERRLGEMEEQFKKKRNFRFAEKTCSSCKHSFPSCDELCLECMHPDLEGGTLVTSQDQVCDAWEAMP